MNKINKRTISARYMSRFEDIFACPLCHSHMKVIEEKSLVCANNHAFDLAKQGYVNLTTQPSNSKYSKDLFEARRKLITKSTFYTPLNNRISDIIKEHFEKNRENLSVFDAGCGEGSHLDHLCDIIGPDFSSGLLGVGVDISKEGIMSAAKHYPHKIWAVADLAKTPFKNEQFDVILNILSPSNYLEFNRLIKKEGLVIKIVPQTNYLIELREAFFDPKSEKQAYSNEDTVARFNDNFHISEHSRLTYVAELDMESMAWLIKMTPLTWTTDQEEIKSFLDRGINRITVDLDILVGRLKPLDSKK